MNERHWEMILLWVMGLTGAAGLFYCFQQTQQNNIYMSTGTNFAFRGDLLKSSILWDRPATPASDEETMSRQAGEVLVGNAKGRVMDRQSFLIQGFDPDRDYYVDLGDGNIKRVLARKFHYQYEQKGRYQLTLLCREGEEFKPVHSRQMTIESASVLDTLRSLSLF